MKTPISGHMIHANGRAVSLLEWISPEQTKWRNCVYFTDETHLELALKIAAVKDDNARALMLEILSFCDRFKKARVEVLKEFETLHSALTKIEKNWEEKP